MRSGTLRRSQLRRRARHPDSASVEPGRARLLDRLVPGKMVDRTLARWRSRGIISTRPHRTIVVHDLETLARITRHPGQAPGLGLAGTGVSVRPLSPGTRDCVEPAQRLRVMTSPASRRDASRGGPPRPSRIGSALNRYHPRVLPGQADPGRAHRNDRRSARTRQFTEPQPSQRRPSPHSDRIAHQPVAPFGLTWCLRASSSTGPSSCPFTVAGDTLVSVEREGRRPPRATWRLEDVGVEVARLASTPSYIPLPHPRANTRIWPWPARPGCPGHMHGR